MTEKVESWFHPGTPFWTGFTAFCANVIALLGLDSAGSIELTHDWLAALLASLFVAGAVYGRTKIGETKEGDPGT